MTKKQHFIPRAAYLRNFSNTRYSDDRKNALQFLEVQSLRSGMSNVYDLGCENCLYEDSNLDFNAVENFLSEIEADIARNCQRLLIGVLNHIVIALVSYMRKMKLKI